jgi:2'-5' RNA ligase
VSELSDAQAMQHWAEWQKAYVHGVILIWPPDDVRTRVNPLRTTYDPVSQSACEAHISLTPPFLASPGEQDWQAIERVVARHAPMDIIYGLVNSFGLDVIYLEVHPFEPLAALRDALLATGLFAVPEHATFVPHMTITEGHSGVPITTELLGKLRATVACGAFRLSELAYIRPDENFQFTVRRSVVLGGRPADLAQTPQAPAALN